MNKAYYSKFGLQGHEGLDLIPTGADWSVYSLPYKGQVVRDIDMESKGGAYGVHTTVFYPDIKEAWMYCHLKSNSVYEGQELDPSTYLGQMGDTGNTFGAHLHVNRFKVDSRGYRLNKDNGFLGGIDPLPFLQQDLTPPAPAPTSAPPAGDVQSKRQIIKDVYQALTGHDPSDDTLAWRLTQALNTRDLIIDILNNDGEAKARWRTIPEDLAKRSTKELLEALGKKLLG